MEHLRAKSAERGMLAGTSCIAGPRQRAPRSPPAAARHSWPPCSRASACFGAHELVATRGTFPRVRRRLRVVGHVDMKAAVARSGHAAFSLSHFPRVPLRSPLEACEVSCAADLYLPRPSFLSDTKLLSMPPAAGASCDLAAGALVCSPATCAESAADHRRFGPRRCPAHHARLKV